MKKMCYCGNTLPYEQCCRLIIDDPTKAQSAEQLMRARYTAFCTHEISFLYLTYLLEIRRFQNKQDIANWSNSARFFQLHILKSTTNIVEFEAHYMDKDNTIQIHHERSSFRKFKNVWYYVDGISMN